MATPALWNCELEVGKSVGPNIPPESCLAVKQAVLTLPNGIKADSSSACTVWATCLNDEEKQVKFALCVLRPMVCENVKVSVMVPDDEDLKFSIVGGPVGAKVFLSGYYRVLADDFNESDEGSEDFQRLLNQESDDSEEDEEESEEEIVQEPVPQKILPKPVEKKMQGPNRRNNQKAQVVSMEIDTVKQSTEVKTAVVVKDTDKPAIAAGNKKPAQKMQKGQPLVAQTTAVPEKEVSDNEESSVPAKAIPAVNKRQNVKKVPVANQNIIKPIPAKNAAKSVEQKSAINQNSPKPVVTKVINNNQESASKPGNEGQQGNRRNKRRRKQSEGNN